MKISKEAQISAGNLFQVDVSVRRILLRREMAFSIFGNAWIPSYSMIYAKSDVFLAVHREVKLLNLC